MTKPIYNFILTIILAFILSLFLPWWSVMIAAFIASISISLKGFKVFLIPFLAIALYWLIYAFILSSGNDFTLSKKIGVLFGLGESWTAILLITGLIGGLAAGIAAMFGKQLSLLFTK